MRFGIYITDRQERREWLEDKNGLIINYDCREITNAHVENYKIRMGIECEVRPFKHLTNNIERKG